MTEWSETGKDLLEQIASSIDCGKSTFRCPLFNTVHRIIPYRDKNGIKFWAVNYRGFRYIVTFETYKNWKTNFWVLSLLLKTDNGIKSNKITLLKEDFSLYLNLTTDGEFTGFQINGTQEKKT